MATSSSLGVAGVGACFLAVALTGGLRRWWWCFLPAVVAYGAWYATRGATAPQGTVDWEYLPSVPGDALRLLGNAAGRLFGLEGGGVIAGGGGGRGAGRRVRVARLEAPAAPLGPGVRRGPGGLPAAW